jgi:ABC-type phosphate transport system substrate-binding protein
MKIRFFFSIFIFFAYSVVANAHESIAIIVNKDLNVTGISSSKLARIFKGQIDRWTNGRQINVINRHFSLKIRKQFYKRVLKAKPTQKFVKPGTPLPFKTKIAKSPRSAVTFVNRIPDSISYVYLSEVSPKVKILKVDGKLPKDMGYPIFGGNTSNFKTFVSFSVPISNKNEEKE